MQPTCNTVVPPAVWWYKSCEFDSPWWCITIPQVIKNILDFFSKHDICMTPKFQCEESCCRIFGSSQESTCGPFGFENVRITTWRHCIFWHSFYVLQQWTWVNYISNVSSIKTILFDILDFWCQLVVIRYVKTYANAHIQTNEEKKKTHIHRSNLIFDLDISLFMLFMRITRCSHTLLIIIAFLFSNVYLFSIYSYIYFIVRVFF